MDRGRGACRRHSGAKTTFCDVNGDGIISPSDALMVINYLLRHSNAPIASAAAAPAAQIDRVPTSNSSAAQTFAAVDQAHSQMSATDRHGNAASAAAAIASMPRPSPISPPPAPIVTLSPAAVRLVFASTAKKPAVQAASSPGELDV